MQGCVINVCEEETNPNSSPRGDKKTKTPFYVNVDMPQYDFKLSAVCQNHVSVRKRRELVWQA